MNGASAPPHPPPKILKMGIIHAMRMTSGIMIVRCTSRFLLVKPVKVNKYYIPVNWELFAGSMFWREKITIFGSKKMNMKKQMCKTEKNP